MSTTSQEHKNIWINNDWILTSYPSLVYTYSETRTNRGVEDQPQVTFSICFFNYIIKNPQTTIALTFLTHNISAMGGVKNNKINLWPSDGRTIVPSIHGSIILYWRLSDLRLQQPFFVFVYTGKKSYHVSKICVGGSLNEKI